MPIKTKQPFATPQRVDAIHDPDVRPDDKITTPPTIAMEQPIVLPDNFDELPIEEQERIKARIRFSGFRLRADIKERSIPISRETLDL